MTTIRASYDTFTTTTGDTWIRTDFSPSVSTSPAMIPLYYRNINGEWVVSVEPHEEEKEDGDALERLRGYGE